MKPKIKNPARFFMVIEQPCEGGELHSRVEIDLSEFRGEIVEVYVNALKTDIDLQRENLLSSNPSDGSKRAIDGARESLNKKVDAMPFDCVSFEKSGDE